MRSAEQLTKTSAAVPRSSFGVLAIAVDPAVQGHGVGRELMASASAAATAAGFESMHLSVHPDNLQAVSFYESLGWRRAPEDDGGWVGRMRIPLDDATSDPAGSG